jgi:flagellar P-ring protein precursor FlgI
MMKSLFYKITALKPFYIFCILLSLPSLAFGLTVKDLVTIEGEQENEISGQGLVIGLNGTGDKKNALKDNMLQAFFHNSDLDVPAERFETKNVAIVNVSGKLPPYAGKGQKIPLRVSTVGDAKSLNGGILLYTKLHYPGAAGSKQIIFATAQGPIVIGDGQLETVGQVDGIVHTVVPSTVVREGMMKLQLKKPNWVDADRIARQINQHFQRLTNRMDQAKAVNPGIIEVEVPKQFEGSEVSFVAQMKNVPVLFTDVPAKILINSRTNMVMLNEKVEVSPFHFAYKDLNVVVGGGPKQAPNLDSQYVQSVALQNPENTDLQNLVDALNAMRVEPEDLVEIIKYAHKIGAIQAELIVE